MFFSCLTLLLFFFFFSSRRRHTRLQGDWSSDVCSSDLLYQTWDRPPGLSSSCYKCVVSYYERHLPHWQPEGAALFLTWRLARIAPENRADLGSPWVKLFQQIRAGQWFRYFNGAEVLAGVLVLISWTATAGLALLACTMAAADSIFSGIFFIALSALWWSRRSR